MPIVWIYKIMVMAKGKGWRPKQRKTIQCLISNGISVMKADFIQEKIKIEW